VDENGIVQAYDASLVLQYVAGASGLILACQQSANADVTLDGTISALDATGILKQVVGLIPAFPYQESEGEGEFKLLAFGHDRTVDLDLRLEAATQIHSYEATLLYDHEKLMFNDSAWPDGVTRVLEHDQGRVRIAASSVDPINEPLSMATLRFTLLKSDAPISFRVSRLRFNENPEQIDIASVILTPTPVENATAQVPEEFSLQQNYPNPFNPSTLIRVATPVNANVKLEVFDALGQRVAELANGEFQGGYREIAWHATAPSGLYICRMTAVAVDDPSKRFTASRKMLLIK
jgi:hypothetical protein